MYIKSINHLTLGRAAVAHATDNVLFLCMERRTDYSDITLIKVDIHDSLKTLQWKHQPRTVMSSLRVGGLCVQTAYTVSEVC